MISEKEQPEIKKQLYIAITIIVIGAGAFSIRTLFSPRLHTAYSGTYEVMGTFARIAVVAPDKRTANASIDAALYELNRIYLMMSDYDPDSQLSQLNRNAYKETVFVNPDLFRVLSLGVKYAEQSEGAFDTTIGPVIDLWRQSEKDGRLPTEEEISKAQSKVGYKKLIFGDFGNTLKFSIEGMRLDLGGIAKGYAIDSAASLMRQVGAVGGLIDVGGDIFCFGTPPKPKKYWRIGLQDPASEGGVLLILKLKDMAVATSGDYQRFYEIDDEKHSHIMNPKTSSSAKELTSVTIIAPTAAKADALATAVSVMGAGKGLGMIEGIENTEAILIPSEKNRELLHTKTVRRFIDNSQPPAGYTAASQILVTQQKQP